MSEKLNKGFSTGLALVAGAVLVLVVVVVWATSGSNEPAPVTKAEPAPKAGSLTGTVEESVGLYRHGINTGSEYISFDKSGTIGAGSNQASWRNTTGRTVYVDLLTAIKTATGSTTSGWIFYAGTSSAATYSTDFTAPVWAPLIDGAESASGTPPTVYSSIEYSTAGLSIIPVLDGEYLNIAFFTRYFSNCTGATCEKATSTNRGFNVDWYFRGHYKP